MAILIKIRGLEDVSPKAKKAEEKLAKLFERRVKVATLFILRESNKTVPVEFGNLRASGFARVTGSGFKAVGSVGYTADYAIYVHENLDALHGDDYNTIYRKDIAAGRKRARGSGQRAKFLEDAIRENMDTLRGIMRGETATK